VQTEERQDRHDHDNKADQINNSIHAQTSFAFCSVQARSKDKPNARVIVPETHVISFSSRFCSAMGAVAKACYDEGIENALSAIP
jgi:hypothetical protein